MAGEVPLPVQESPDEQQLLTFGPYTAATSANQVLWGADRDTVIDSASAYGSLESTTDTITLTLFRGDSTDDDLADMVFEARDIGTVNIGDEGGTAAPFVKNFTMTSDENLIEAGDLVVMSISGAPTAAEMWWVQLRIRSKRR